ncbi:hypothetical protein AMS68_005345 [Peltaster fructicola]|uniref:DNA damage-binding protein CMR1 n=1 Tax=Peltaster fructicola TaxID=286661 RepID=A0A6H0XZ04_9PEZI|nr:hypothetical protein AMS68_005345 [Peltaster fructicola]
MAIKSKTGAGLSEYEIARQEKIAKNQALLQQLQLDAQQAGIGARAKSKPSSNTAQKRKRPVERIKKEEVVPRRSSARLQGIVADSEVARQKEEKEAEVFAEQQKIKRQRVSGDISLGDAVVLGNWDLKGNWLRNVRPADPGTRTFDDQDVRETTDKQLRELRERMSSLQLWEGAEPSRIKITPERIYSLGFHPTTDKALVLAGDKLGSLGVFDASQTSPEQIKQEAEDADAEDVDEGFDPAITTFKIHTRTISAFQFAPNNDNHLYSASYDSSIRRLDLDAAKAVEIYGPLDKESDEPISGVEISRTDPNLLHFTTLNGAFGMKDIRTPSHETIELMQLSEKKIGGFSLHPTHPYLLATASLDRRLCLWDLRKITGKKDRTPTLIAEHESKLSVSHAAFNAAGQVATASYDDTVKVYDLADLTTQSPSAWPLDELKPSTIIPHNNQTGRWVTILRAQWQMQPQDGVQRFVIGNMNRFVDIYSGSGQQLAQLGGEGITAVPAVAKFHERMDWVAAGTASGKLCLWM